MSINTALRVSEQTGQDQERDEDQFKKIALDLIPLLESYQVFYAVLQMEKQSLERIESTLILRLQESAQAKQFLDNARPSRTDGVPVNIDLAWPGDCKVAGL